MRYFLIFNPGSNSNRSIKKFDTILRILEQEKLEFTYKVTNTLEEAYLFSREANNTGYEVIVAVGGDGTINRVINGFYDGLGKRFSTAKMGVVYTGTSPDFCRSYSIPLKLQEAVRVLVQGNSRHIQIGKITFSPSLLREQNDRSFVDTEKCNTKYFACCANIGLGPLVAAKANSGLRKKLGDFLGTLMGLLQILPSYKSSSFTILQDNHHRVLNNVHNISIGKTFYIASGIKIFNTLTTEDKQFYILTVKNVKVRDWLKILTKLYSGQPIVNDNKISLDYCHSIEIRRNDEHPGIEFDGDFAGFLPCKIELAKDSLEVLCGAQK